MKKINELNFNGLKVALHIVLTKTISTTYYEWFFITLIKCAFNHHIHKKL